MITAAMSRRARELADQGVVFATATVVRAQRPTSVTAGDVALVLADGTMEGFVGGECTEHSVRAYALKSMQTGEAVLLRILPFDENDGGAADAVTGADGSVTVQNPCLSGGAKSIRNPPLPAPSNLPRRNLILRSTTQCVRSSLPYTQAETSLMLTTTRAKSLGGSCFALERSGMRSQRF